MIGQLQPAGVDPWFLLAMVMLLIALAIGAWAVARERHFFEMSRLQTSSFQNLDRTIASYGDNFKNAFANVTDGLRSVEHQVERSEDLSEGRRQEIIRLIVDVERRLTDALNDWINRGHGGASVHVNTNGGQNNIGQTHIRGNQQQS